MGSLTSAGQEAFYRYFSPDIFKHPLKKKSKTLYGIVELRIVVFVYFLYFGTFGSSLGSWKGAMICASVDEFSPVLTSAQEVAQTLVL